MYFILIKVGNMQNNHALQWRSQKSLKGGAHQMNLEKKAPYQLNTLFVILS